MNLNKDYKLGSLILIFSLTISACSILPDMSDIPFIGNKQADKEVPDLEPIDFFGDETDTVVEELSKEEQAAQALRNEWEAVRPAINRLIELESDLAFLIDQLNQSATGPDFPSTSANRQFVVNESTENFGTAVPTEQALLALGQPSVELMPARPVTLSGNEGVNQQKFNGAPLEQNTSMSPQLSPPTSRLEVSDNKFSGINSSVSLPKVNSETCPSIGKGEGFSMHIASFKKREKARSLLSQYRNRLLQGEPCGNKAMIEEVEVNGVVFFSARLGVFNSREDALTACNAVKNIQSYCAVTRNQGVPLV